MDACTQGWRDEDRWNFAMALVQGRTPEASLGVWQRHLDDCPSCSAMVDWARWIHDRAGDLAQRSLELPCNHLSLDDAVLYLDRANRACPEAVVLRVEAHLRTCPLCAEFFDQYDSSAFLGSRTGSGNLLRNGLPRRLEALSASGVAWVRRAIERLQSDVPLSPTPSIEMALGARMLRAFRPINTMVRLPFIFSWAPLSTAHEFEVWVREFDGLDETRLRVIPQDAPRQRLESTALDIDWQPGTQYLWSATALDSQGAPLADTNRVSFTVIDVEIPERDVDRVLGGKVDYYTEAYDVVAETVRLASHGLYDEAVSVLMDNSAAEKAFLAACIVSLYEHRLAKTEFPADRRQLRGALGAWESVLARLKGKKPASPKHSGGDESSHEKDEP